MNFETPEQKSPTREGVDKWEGQAEEKFQELSTEERAEAGKILFGELSHDKKLELFQRLGMKTSIEEPMTEKKEDSPEIKYKDRDGMYNEKFNKTNL